jgi:hypothetical protein
MHSHCIVIVLSRGPLSAFGDRLPGFGLVVGWVGLPGYPCRVSYVGTSLERLCISHSHAKSEDANISHFNDFNINRSSLSLLLIILFILHEK